MPLKPPTHFYFEFFKGQCSSFLFYFWEMTLLLPFTTWIFNFIWNQPILRKIKSNQKKIQNFHISCSIVAGKFCTEIRFTRHTIAYMGNLRSGIQEFCSIRVYAFDASVDTKFARVFDLVRQFLTRKMYLHLNILPSIILQIVLERSRAESKR